MTIEIKIIAIIIFLISTYFVGFYYGQKTTIKKFKPYKPTIMIDLDGVLDEYSHYEKDTIPPIKKDAREFLEKLNSKNKYYLVLFTTRNKFMAKAWLKENDIDKYFIDVTRVKYPAYIYLDDRAVQFNGDYEQTLKDIEHFKPYWK